VDLILNYFSSIEIFYFIVIAIIVIAGIWFFVSDKEATNDVVTEGVATEEVLEEGADAVAEEASADDATDGAAAADHYR